MKWQTILKKKQQGRILTITAPLCVLALVNQFVRIYTQCVYLSSAQVTTSQPSIKCFHFILHIIWLWKFSTQHNRMVDNLLKRMNDTLSFKFTLTFDGVLCVCWCCYCVCVCVYRNCMGAQDPWHHVRDIADAIDNSIKKDITHKHTRIRTH